MTKAISRPSRGFWCGLLLMAVFAGVAVALAQLPLFKETLRISPLIISVLIGMIYANTLRHKLNPTWVPGLAFSSKRILRLAIVFYAFRLTLADIYEAGATAFIYDLIIVSSVILLGVLIGRWLKMDRDTAILTASGSAICGAAAVLGTEPVLGASSEKTVIAVATVVLFGTLSMFIYPLVHATGWLGLTDHQMAIYTGGTLHEVAHVAGAGGAMGEAIASTATITKMIRVILLAPFLLILTSVLHRGGRAGATGQSKVSIPWFAIWFLIMICVNTLIAYLAEQQGVNNLYDQVCGGIRWADDFGLCMAMAALGSDASFARFKRAGGKPFLLAGALYLWLTIGGYCLIRLIG